MKGFIKKNIFILVSFLALSALGISYMVLNSLKEDSNFYIKTVSGDKSVLENLEISGVLQDSYGGVNFKLMNGKVDKEFNYYNDEQDYWRHLTSGMNNKAKNLMVIKDVDYSINVHKDNDNESTVNIYRRFRKLSSKAEDEYLELKGDFSTSAVDYYPSGLAQMQFVEEIEGKVYLVIPTNETFTGKSSIYEISKFSKDQYNRDSGTYRKLADIDLEGGKVQVLGMVAVKNNLCVITRVQDEIALRVFNLVKETFLPVSEVVFQDLYIDGIYSYGDYLIINQAYGESQSKISVINISDTMSLVTKIDRQAIGSERVNSDMIYKNGRLYTIRERIMYPEENKDLKFNPSLRMPRFSLDLVVYAVDGSIVFNGSLESDAVDDLIWTHNDFGNSNSYHYPQRQYESIKLK
jgi:hypothetical protein